MARITQFILAILCFFLFSTCKKGEDDKGISLKSKKSKLSGEWRLVSGNADLTTEGYNETYSFDGTHVVWTSTLYYPVSDKYTLSLTIKKDGTFSFKEILAGTRLEASGTWNFNTGVGKEKRKEDVLFSIDDVDHGYTDGNNLFNRFSTNFKYTIKDLGSKKLVIHSAGKLFSDARWGYVTFSTDYTFQK
jgi:hypothetical protein